MLAVELETRLGALELVVSVTVAPGSCLALAGPSGAGKSSVLRAIAGLHRPSYGRVAWDGEDWLHTARGVHLPPERRRCGYVFQDYALFDHLPVWRNVAYPLRGMRRAERRERAHELLDRLGIGALADARPPTLSGGERQRVALARALAREPDVLLLDEPLSALDARTRAHAARTLAGVLREARTASVLVTHDFTEAAVLADRVAVIDAGRIVQQGTASELASAPASAFVADFTGALVMTGTARQGPDHVTLVDLDGGGTVATVEPAQGPVAVSVFPWEVSVAPAGATPVGSAQNHLTAEIVSITAIGNRVRLGLAGPQPLSAEVTETAVRELELAPGRRVTATWKAAATRVVAR